MSDYPTISEDPNGGKTPELSALQKLASLFPAAVKDGQLDVEALKEELGDFPEIQPGDEKYELNWAGKQKAKKKAYEPLLGKTLKPLDDGVNADTTENLYIEGDNLEALKLLRTNYYGEVKMIYIDPPYNTGKDFVYTDKFVTTTAESDADEGLISDEGERLQKNEKSSNRFHAKWLDMMYPRLKLAKDLLREDGVIFISIDDNEVANLRKICDEVFGKENEINPIIHNKLNSKNDIANVQRNHDYIICYNKRTQYISNSKIKPTLFRNLEHEKEVFKEGTKFYYLNDPITTRGDGGTLKKRENLGYTVYYHPEKKDFYPKIDYDISLVKNGSDLTEKELYTDDKESIKAGYIPIRPPLVRGALGAWTWEYDTFIKNKTLIKIKETKNGYQVRKRTFIPIDFKVKERGGRYYALINELKNSRSIIEYSSNDGAKQLAEILGASNLFSHPKNTNILSYIIALVQNKECITLDFFSGSAPCAHAVMKLNSEDGGTRKHIMVQLPEITSEKSEAKKAGYDTIAEIGKERIRRAGAKILEELKEKAQTATDEEKATNPYLANPDALDIGFKSFRIEETKINWLKKDLAGEELDPAAIEMSDKDKLDFVPGFTDLDIVYEVMLRQSNIPLTQQITNPISNAPRTYLYGESYLICLEEKVTKELVVALAKLEPTPLKYIFRDSAFDEDIELKKSTFRRLNAEIEKNTDGGEAYTVEFL